MYFSPWPSTPCSHLVWIRSTYRCFQAANFSSKTPVQSPNDLDFTSRDKSSRSFSVSAYLEAGRRLLRAPLNRSSVHPIFQKLLRSLYLKPPLPFLSSSSAASTFELQYCNKKMAFRRLTALASLFKFFFHSVSLPPFPFNCSAGNPLE